MFTSFKKIKILTIVLVGILFFQNTVIGQIATENILSIDISTKNPLPGENVTIKLNSYLINLDTSKITWYIDNVYKKEGAGQKELTVKAKNIGQKTTIKAAVTTKDGKTNQIETSISPIIVSLITESQSYTPLFYKGKQIFPYQGTVKITAIPEIINPKTNKKINTEDLIFKWSKDSIVIGEASGLGKNSITIEEGLTTSRTSLSLEIYDSNNILLISTTKELVSSEPRIVFYEKNPIYGILYNKAISNNFFLGDKEEIDLIAEPFFFSKGRESADLVYNWKVNSKKITDEKIRSEILLKKIENIKKSITYLSLSIENKKTLFQNTTNNISIKYGE